MGKVALIVVAIAMFAGVFVSLGTRDNLHGAGEQVAEHQLQILSRTAAVAAHNRAVQRLADNFATQQPYYGDYDGVGYTTSITVTGVGPGAQAEVHSIATTFNVDGDSMNFNIRAIFEQVQTPTGIAEEAPPFLGYAVLSDKNLSMNGNIEATICEICVTGEEALTLNANMHTNGSLHVTGNSAEVQGFGTFVGSGTSNPGKALKRTFEPHYNPTGAPSTQQVPGITLPSLNVSNIETMLSADSVTTGDVVLTGAQSLGGTREDPFIWYITGSLTNTGGMSLDGYVMFLVEGDVNFTGNATAGSTSWSGADESSAAFYVEGDVSFNGNVEVWGQVFNNGDIHFQGTPDVYGSITTHGTVNFGGTVNIYYRRASPALTTHWNAPTFDRLRRLAYSEW